MEEKARPKIEYFLKDMLEISKLKDKFHIFYRKSKICSFLKFL